MNKNLLILGAVVLVIAIGGYLFLNRNPQVSPTTNNPQNIEEMSNIVMSAFEGNGSVKCTFQDESSQGTVFIKNGMMRMESAGTAGAQNGNVILKNDTMWFWENESTEGFMMENVSQYQNDPDISEEYKVDAESVRDEIEKKDASCVEENIADGVFEVPASVTFKNYSSMMEDVQTQTPEGFELPEGVELPEGYTYPSN